ncbi:hypothetical protein ASG40_10375 [Methylobacterium sp. Leaf399]|uniref:plasmid mobilization protein n=1 Tax=Methylobacterium sp. Leaf399 TaxID=1736364 RepID=UPI0006FDEDD0|nr:plasmid mobilization relaxosome protein MobC [Methylobacterium sp. Leaf399]KQT09059.1 hypothetical protein ASG40_10375 [Methylobacterium sp. Leaf399]
MATDATFPSLCEVVTLKLRPEERATLRATAAGLGVGPSSYAADAVRRALGTERRRPLPQPRSARTEAVREATGALGRLGNLINQIARRTNQGQPVQAAELAAIRAALAAIDARLCTALEA